MSLIRINKHTLINVVDPDPRDICVTDIARVLSTIPRFNGHGEKRRRIYVSEHSVNVYLSVKNFVEYTKSVDCYNCFFNGCDLKALYLAALLHDGHEFIISDIATPIKELIGRSNIKAVTRPLDEAIASAVGFDPDLMEHIEIKTADAYMLDLEGAWLFDRIDARTETDFQEILKRRSVKFRAGIFNSNHKIGLNSEEAEMLFMATFEEICAL